MRIIKKYSPGNISLGTHRIFQKDTPHIKSYANLILLNEFYRKRDDEQVTYREFKMQRIFFSIKFLSSCKKIHGSLKCVYCNKKDLWICDNLKHKFTEEDYKTLATTDHFIPISKGGDIFDKDNCVVACHECNQKKKDKIGYIDKNGNYKF